MVSRRNFISIILMMAVLFFMFQFSQVIKIRGNDYNINEYINEETLITEDDVYEVPIDEFVLFLGDGSGDTGRHVEEWCFYSKFKMRAHTDVADTIPSEWNLAKVILVDSSSFDAIANVSLLEEQVRSGKPVIFCNLPEVSEIRKSTEFCNFLGISSVKEDSVTVEGIEFFDGFLLGGEAAYKAAKPEDEKYADLDLEMPWFETDTGVTAYGIGLLDSVDDNANRYPRIVWRHSFGDGFVAAVNGDYLATDASCGFLSALYYEVSDYSIYPVVNSRNMVVSEFPFVTDENAAQIAEEYSMTPTALCRDIVWPSVLSISEINNLKLTCALPMGYESLLESTGSSKYASFYLGQINEIDGEAALSVNFDDEGSVRDRMLSGLKFWNEESRGYRFGVMFADRMDSGMLRERTVGNEVTFRTVVTEETDNEFRDFFYLDKSMLVLPVTERAEEYSYSKDLTFRSRLSSIGYSNILIDMHDVQWPEDTKDEWQNLSKELSGNIHTHWGKNDYFDYTPVSQSDTRVRKFLQSGYKTYKDENGIINLELYGSDESYYILRTHGEEIDEIACASYTELEDGVYLLHCYNTKVMITLKESDNVLSFKGVL
ncbi:MAG: DUF2194 domain-containing protein [Lachnospiraceae bacterium]|nr:DUF2194 domain-containing protein [Lachnospiraceae bacterium]